MPKVAVIMGSASDLPVIKKGIDLLKQFGVTVDVQVISAHRAPIKLAQYALAAQEEGVEVVIAAAGKAAHLPGVFAAYTYLPVIGLPILSSFMDGLDSLLSIVQMPTGIPVATVGVNAAENAALLAIQMLCLKYPQLQEEMVRYRKNMADALTKAGEEVRAQF